MKDRKVEKFSIVDPIFGPGRIMALIKVSYQLSEMEVCNHQGFTLSLTKAA